MREDEKRAILLDFVNGCFRDTADQDYIAARLLYRVGLVPQFLWSGHQAVEKYLKAILLFSDVSTKELGHDLERALGRLSAIPDIPFDIPDDIRTFIAHLNEEGANRYFEFPTATLGSELLELDRTVWTLRRYCYWMRGTYATPAGPVERLPREVAAVNSIAPQDVHRFRISSGYLEAILSKRGSRLREALVWKNFYYGSRKKRVIKRFTHRMGISNPAHYLDPEIFEELAQRVQFSKAVIEVFRKRSSGATPA